MAAPDRDSFTEYDFEDGILHLRKIEDVSKVPLGVYARAIKIMVKNTVVLDRSKELS